MISPLSARSALRPSDGNTVGRMAVRASVPPFAAEAMPAPTVTTTWAPSPAARAHRRNLIAFLDELVNGAVGTAEVIALAMIWLLGAIWWLSDERVREHLWRQLGT